MAVRNLIAVLTICFLAGSSLYAGTTGKITGVITDKENGQPVPGVNVIVEGTLLGAATDMDGVYIILNIPPGTYTIQAVQLDDKKLPIYVMVACTGSLEWKLEQTG